MPRHDETPSGPFDRSDFTARFATTRWPVVKRAAEGDLSARTELYRTYARPLYHYLRWRHCLEPDAEDLVQTLFLNLFQGDQLGNLDPENGRLRTYLMLCANNAMADGIKKRGAQKRGGSQPPLSWDELKAARGEEFEPIDHRTPEENFDRLWALELLGRSIDRISEEIRKEAGEEFLLLKGALLPEGLTESYATVAAQLKTTEQAIKSRVHRLRKRLGEILREEVRNTVGSAELVADELRYLLLSLRGK